jgi:hypothetical protein
MPYLLNRQLRKLTITLEAEGKVCLNHNLPFYDIRSDGLGRFFLAS